MRVALIVNRFPNVSETFVVSRFLGLIERGWDAHVFCTKSSQCDWRSFEQLREPSLKRRVHVRRPVPSHARIALTLPILLLKAALRSPIRMMRYLALGAKAYGRGVAGHFVEDSALLRFDPDLLHFEFGHFAVRREALGKMLSCALVASFQGWDLNYVGLNDPNYYRQLWAQLDAAHFVSEDLLRRARRRGFSDDGPAHVVYNGIDVGRFSASGRNYADGVGSRSRPLRLLSVGRLHWKKGYAYALQAVRELIDAGIDCEYRIVGDGEHREALEFTIDDLGLHNVTLLGAQPSDRVRQELLWADVFVHSAVSEGFCIAVTEAQATGLPVVVSDADGLRENVDDTETGFVVPRRSAEAIYERLRTLSSDAKLRARMGRAAAERARTRFTLTAHLDGIENVYRSALRRRAERQRSPSGTR